MTESQLVEPLENGFNFLLAIWDTLPDPVYYFIVVSIILYLLIAWINLLQRLR